VDTQTYIFPDDVLKQPPTPVGFPTSWGAELADVQGQMGVLPVAADYEMDSRVVNDPTSKEILKEGLASNPTLSLVIDAQNLADFYVSAYNKSEEHPVSVEYITSDGVGESFQINAGIKPYGNTITAKRSFRLLFKNKYGAAKLEYPLFADSQVDQFDSLLLLSFDNDSFVDPDSTNRDMTYTRDAWLRASQLAMSGTGAHDTFVHLYINGLYWGLYNMAERPDASFMASYLGGEKEDWFVADQEGPLGNDSGTGRLNDLFSLLNLAGRVGGSQNALAGTYTEMASSIDPVQLSDYLILNWYAGTTNWTQNNWFVGIHRQAEARRQGKFLMGDNDVVFKDNGAKIEFSQPTSLIESLFDTLIQDPDFKIQLADRLYLHLFNDGALTDANARARWQQLNRTIDGAIVAESARWGDTNREAPLSREDWLRAQDNVLAQINDNAVRLVGMAREAGYYPQFDPPAFNLDGGLVETGFTLTMKSPASCQDCTIYYTTNGSDPRLPITGEVHPVATAYSNSVVLTGSIQLKARVFSNAPEDTAQPWSALHEVSFNVVEQDNKLRITEVMYNPLGGDDYEFVELKNTGNSDVELANISIDEGIRFTFPPNTLPLSPGEFMVLVSNPVSFAEQYPDVTIGGAYEGHLSNKGEKIVLRDAQGQTLLEFEYNDEYGWPVSPDGRGDSLILVNQSGDPNNPNNWRASHNLNGSPGADEPEVGSTALSLQSRRVWGVSPVFPFLSLVVTTSP
jgi:hypothetical protein